MTKCKDRCNELTNLSPHMPSLPFCLIHWDVLKIILDLWKMASLPEKQLFSVFVMQCSSSSDASLILWFSSLRKLLLAVGQRPGLWTLSVFKVCVQFVLQVCVQHFWDSQAISDKLSMTAPTAPTLFLQIACEPCTQDTTQWHTDTSVLPKLWSGWYDSLLAKPYTQNASLLVCSISSAHCKYA